MADTGLSAGSPRGLSLFLMFCVFLAFTPNALGKYEFSLSGVITDNMIFQRNQQIIIWGWGVPRTTVNATLNGVPGSTTVDEGTYFQVTLPPQSAGGPYVLTVGHSEGVVEVQNIYVGEVLLCSGQSNMQFTVDQSFNVTAEVAAAANYSLIHLYTVTELSTQSNTWNTTGYGGGWLVAAPDTVGYANWTYFSAICYYTGRRLFLYLQSTEGQSIAVGLVSSSYGGTSIQAWSDSYVLKQCPKCAPSSGGQRNDPTGLWHGMIVPILNLRFRSILWDQGETDLEHPVPNGWDYYSCWFPKMIVSWRSHFNATLPFYFVQLPGFVLHGVKGIAPMRLAQAEALALPLTGMAVTYDVPDPTSPFGSVHNRNKETVAQRLWLNMMAITYNVSGIDYQGPTLNDMQITQYNSTTLQVTVTYQQGTADTPLAFEGVSQCVECCEQYWNLFVFSNDGKNYVNASQVSLNSDGTVAILVNGLSEINYAYYLNQERPQCALKNQQGLPAAPFFWQSKQRLNLVE